MGTLSLFGASLSFVLYNFQSSILFNKKWFFDKLYSELFGQFFFKFGYTISYKSIDRGAFEIMGPAGLSAVASNVAYKLHKAQTGSLYHYTLLILTTVALVLSMRQIWLIFEYNIDYR